MILEQNLEQFHYLESLLKSVSDNKSFYLCIYDLSGIHYNNALLQIPEKNKFHDSTFCKFVKTSHQGFRYCLKCKYRSIHRASQQDETYVSQCFMGITEIVKPVFINNRIASVIYLGNLLDQKKENEIKDKVVKRSKSIGISPEKMLERLKLVQPVDAASLEEYIKIVDLIHSSIQFAHSFSNRADRIVENHSNISANYWLTQAVIDFVHANYYMDIRMEHIANLHSVNPNYLRCKFKKESGMCFTEYLNKVRIENAKRLLQNTGLSVIDVSVRMGFNNVTYFNKMFKEFVGITPTAFRDQS